MPRPSRLPLIALILAITALALVVLGPLAARIGLVPPIGGFFAFGIGLLPGAIFALLAGLLAVLRTRGGGDPTGRRRALLATGLAAVLLVLAVLLFRQGSGAPLIHDITTDPEDPPAFVAASRVPDNRGRDLSYPDGGAEVPSLQRTAYPDLAPLQVATGPGLALARARSVAEELGWKVVDEDPVAGRLEATATSSIFGFVDDIVIRVRADGAGGAVLDLRSTSRVGQGDLGANAARIRAFLAAY